MSQPDYLGGSIVNLMASLILGLGGAPHDYMSLRALKPERLQRYRNIVLLVIDGLGNQYLTRAAAGSTLRAHLQGRITSVFPTTTATAITTFYTGLAPQQHGLTGWHSWFKELGCVLKVLPMRPRYGGASLGDVGIDATRLFGHVPVFDRISANSHVIAPQHIAHSDFNLAHRGRAEVRDYQTLEQMFEQVTRAVSTARERSYVYAYWPDLDRIAHEHGSSSDEANSHLAELDAGFARFLGRINGSDTLVIVTADHGIIDTAKECVIELEDHPGLAETLVLPLCGEPRVAYCYVQPDRRHDFERYVSHELAPYAALWPSRELVERNYFGLGISHPRLHERVGDYTLIMKDNFVIKDWLFAEQRYSQVGVHGGLSEQELYVPLIVASC
jgi:arylsulfatase A-like enzyme